ncbi:MAG: PEP-CTERM sorting domain-containing protein [Vicinamibacterales bacterium]
MEYTPVFYERCFLHSGICSQLPIDPFTQTFELESDQLAVDGVYDVDASLDPTFDPWWLVTPPADATSVIISLVANATVVDEQVIEVVIDILEKYKEPAPSGFPTDLSFSFLAQSGIWTRSTGRIEAFQLGGHTSAAYGTYTVHQVPVSVPVPEPGSLFLVLGGGLLASLRTRHRVH